jgi:hypothetical protein
LKKRNDQLVKGECGGVAASNYVSFQGQMWMMSLSADFRKWKNSKRSWNASWPKGALTFGVVNCLLRMNMIGDAKDTSPTNNKKNRMEM